MSGAQTHPEIGSRFDVLIVGAGHAGVHVAATLAPSYRGQHWAPVGREVRAVREATPDQGLPGRRGQRARTPAEAVDLLAELRRDPAPRPGGRDGRRRGTRCGHRARATGSRYGSLVWAAGADPMRIGLPAKELPGVHELRTLEDTVRFRHEVTSGTRVVVVGGGYIGLEAASACVKLGADVTIVESRSRLLAQGDRTRGGRVPPAQAPRERRARGAGRVGHRDR